MEDKWTADEMRSLVDNVLADAVAIKKKFSVFRPEVNLDWDAIKVPGKSSEACQGAFLKMASFVVKHMTLKDIAEMTKLRLGDKRIPLEMVPNAPKKPVPPVTLFCQDRYAALKKKDPAITFFDASKVALEKWKSMSPVKKEKYTKTYEKDKAEYDEMQADFMTKKEKRVKEPKKRTRPDVITPFELFLESAHSETPILEVKQMFESLSDKKKVNLIWQAINRFDNQQDKQNDSEEPTTLKPLHLKDTEKKLLLKSEGIHEKPFKSLRGFYGKKYKDESNDKVNEMFKSLNQEQFVKLSHEWVEEIKDYCSRMASYMSRNLSIPADEKEDIEYHAKNYKKLITRTEAGIEKMIAKKVASKPTKPAKVAPAEKKKPAEKKMSNKRSMDDSSVSSEETSAPVKKQKLNSSSSKLNKSSVAPVEEANTPMEKRSSKRKKSLLNSSTEVEDIDSEVSFKVASSVKKRKGSKVKSAASIKEDLSD